MPGMHYSTTRGPRPDSRVCRRSPVSRSSASRTGNCRASSRGLRTKHSVRPWAQQTQDKQQLELAPRCCSNRRPHTRRVVATVWSQSSCRGSALSNPSETARIFEPAFSGKSASRGWKYARFLSSSRAPKWCVCSAWSPQSVRLRVDPRKHHYIFIFTYQSSSGIWFSALPSCMCGCAQVPSRTVKTQRSSGRRTRGRWYAFPPPRVGPCTRVPRPAESWLAVD